MDTMERLKFQYSMKDAIAILDSAPIHRDLIPEVNLIQLTNRAHPAHLAIEKGIKARIADAGNTPDKTHGLNRLYGDLSKCDKASADFLSVAFQDAVKFFGYKVNTTGFRHFRSLEDYLTKVGTKKVFEELRYWEIEESPKGQSHIQYISLPVHRELLCALSNLVMRRVRETVSARVESEVMHAMFNRRSIVYMDGDTRMEQAVGWYKNWLFKTHITCRSALQEAVCLNFAVNDDEFVTQTLRDAFNELRQSKDPAVRYYIGTLTDLPKGSQLRISDATPEVKWSNQHQTSGMVETPAGTPLGFIEKYADGRWLIEPLADDLDVEPATAKTDVVASRYLVNRLTREVTVTVNRQSKQLRIVGQRWFLPDSKWNSDAEHAGMRYELDFWDATHGLLCGEEVSVELQLEGSDRHVEVLEGKVVEVADNRVSISGMSVLHMKK